MVIKKKEDVPDFTKIPEADKTIDLLKDIFKKVTGVGADKIGLLNKIKYFLR